MMQKLCDRIVVDQRVPTQCLLSIWLLRCAVESALLAATASVDSIQHVNSGIVHRFSGGSRIVYRSTVPHRVGDFSTPAHFSRRYYRRYRFYR